MNTNYQEKLRDPRWQRIRLEKMNAAGWQCEICGDKKTELHVHHKRYDRADDSPDGFVREPWEYFIGEMICLCSDCHSLVHIPEPKIRAFVEKTMEGVDREKIEAEYKERFEKRIETILAKIESDRNRAGAET